MSAAVHNACLPSVPSCFWVQCGLPVVKIVLVINNFYIACSVRLWLAEGKMRINIAWWHFNSYPSGSDRSRMARTSHWFPHPLLSNYLCAQVCQTFSPGLKCQYHSLLIICLLFPWETGISLCIVSLLTFHNSDLSHALPSFLLLWMRIVMPLRASYHRNKDCLTFSSSPLAKTPIFFYFKAIL